MLECYIGFRRGVERSRRTTNAMNPLATSRRSLSAFAEPLEARIAPAVLYAVDSANHLVSFDSADPATLTLDVEIGNLPADTDIVGIDFRPSTGQLYALGLHDDGATRTGQLYVLNPKTGAASAVGAAFSGLADTGDYGFDFDPLSDEIRLSNSFDENISVDPDNGGPVFKGTNLNAPSLENVGAVAYSGNFGDFGTTLFADGSKLYAYNYNSDDLCLVNESTGLLTPVAKANVNGVKFTANSVTMGFDIGGPYGQPDSGWLSVFSSANGTHLYQMDLGTAALTDLGAIGDGSRLFGGLTVSFHADDPVISKNKATWTDLDGDTVTLTVSKGTLTGANFRMIAGENGSVLSKLTLDPTFSGADLKITAKPGPNGGDGRVDIGGIDATGVDLGNVTVPGDVVFIKAGVVGGPSSVKTLSAKSIAVHGLGPLSADHSRTSFLADGAHSIRIAGDVASSFSFGKGHTGSVVIGGDLIGGAYASSASIGNSDDGTMGKFVLQGNIRGGMQGGQVSLTHVDSVFVGGSIIGGGGNSSGYLAVYDSPKTKVVVAGDIVGGSDAGAGGLRAWGVSAVKVGGSLLGGDGGGSGAISTDGVASIFIAGDIVGGKGFKSGSIDGGSASDDIIKTLKVGGSIVSRGEDLSITAARLGQISIGGDVTGTPTGTVRIAGIGIGMPATVADSIAIKKLTIGGDCKYAQILAGQNGFVNTTVDAAIGTVKIGRDMVATSIAAGIDQGNDYFGDGDDQLIGGNAGSPNIVAKIARVTVGGQIFGTSAGPKDSYGIEGELIGQLSVGKKKLPLTAAKNSFTIGGTGDMRVMEF